MTKLEKLRARLAEVREELRELAEVDADELTEEQDTRMSSLEHELEHEVDGDTRGLLADIEREERREAILERAAGASARATEAGDDRGVPNVTRGRDGRERMDLAMRWDARPGELRDAALAVVEERVPEEYREHVERLVRSDDKFGNRARHIIRFADETYERAFGKILADPEGFSLDADERNAIAIGTNSQGGYMVPTHLDPTVLLTNDGTLNPFRRIATVVQLTPADGNVWNGVTSAGVTAGDAGGELVEVGDNSPEFDGPSIPLHKAHAFVGASIEATQDIGGLAGTIVRLLNDARDRLDSQRFAVGTGTNQPTGVVTALLADTNVHVEVATQGALVAADVYKLDAELPARFDQTARYLGHKRIEHTIRQFGTDDPNFTANMLPGNIPGLLGNEFVRSSEVPYTTATNAVNALLTLGDFSNFYIVEKMGMSVEFIPHLFGTTNNRPIGRRGWYAYWRRGSDVVVNNAFRLLVDPDTT